MQDNMDGNLHILYFTKMCNLNCDYCYEVGKEYYKMSKDVIDDVISTVFESADITKRVRFVIFGGEPLLNYDGVIYFLERIYHDYYSKGYLVSCNLITNGTLLKPQRAMDLYKYKKFLSIDISIDGDKDMHDAHRKFKSGIGSFDIVIKNARFLLRCFPRARARMVISDVDRFYENVMYLLHDIGFKEFGFQFLRPNKKCDVEYAKTDEFAGKYMSVIEQIQKYFDTLENVVINDYNIPLQYSKNRIEEALASDNQYRYFLPNGEKVFQKQYIDNSFEHFTKGKDAVYNLLNHDII